MVAGLHLDGSFVGSSRWLLEAGAMLGSASSNGRTPLLLTDEFSPRAVVSMLQGTPRWRRRRALALSREQRAARSDWRKAVKSRDCCRNVVVVAVMVVMRCSS